MTRLRLGTTPLILGRRQGIAQAAYQGALRAAAERFRGDLPHLTPTARSSSANVRTGAEPFGDRRAHTRVTDEVPVIEPGEVELV